MANPEFFRSAFDDLAVSGFIGDPEGQPAYAYMRVSTAAQAEEGKTGLPRQIQSIHKVALLKGLRVSWDLVYADDSSGFEWKDRPELGRLLKGIREPGRKANYLIFEALDRLSRNADWHQGYLLEQFKRKNIQVFASKDITNRILRAVEGAISQDGMEASRERMVAGMNIKAQSGRVTARFPAYGYFLADKNGKPLGDAPKKDSYYAINEEQAYWVRYFYEQVAYGGKSLDGLANEMNTKIPAPRGSRWYATTLLYILRNPVYKGQYIHNRSKSVKRNHLIKDSYIPQASTEYIALERRPPEEWIIVNVPPIVTEELWNDTCHALDLHKQHSRRNAKQQYLLTGLLKSATCGHNFCGNVHRAKNRYPGEKDHVYYRCTFSTFRYQDVRCPQLTLNATAADKLVWDVVCQALIDPKVILDALDEEVGSDKNTQIAEQINFLQNEIKVYEKEKNLVFGLYRHEQISMDEFSTQFAPINEAIGNLKKEIETAKSNFVAPEEIESCKEQVRRAVEQAKKAGLSLDADFTIRRRIVLTVIDKIVVNVNEGWLEIFGLIRGSWNLGGDALEGDSSNILHTHHIG